MLSILGFEYKFACIILWSNALQCNSVSTCRIGSFCLRTAGWVIKAIFEKMVTCIFLMKILCFFSCWFVFWGWRRVLLVSMIDCDNTARLVWKEKHKLAFTFWIDIGRSWARFLSASRHIKDLMRYRLWIVYG